MIERLNESLAYLEQHLDGTVEVSELARIAATSEYHYRRLFSALAGMPISEYLRRRRLTVAAAEVLAGQRSILEIALRYGYGSGEAFTRAFRAMHGTGPAEARRAGTSLQSQARISFRLMVEGSSNMQYRIVQKDAFRVAGKRARVPLIYEGVNPAIEAFVLSIDEDTNERIYTLSDQEPRGFVSVCDNFTGDREEGSELDYYHAVVTSAPVPADLDVLDVPAGMWVVFEARGAFPEAAQYLWRDAYGEWFPSNPYQTRPGPEILMVELTETGESGVAELWLPVEPVPAA